MPLVQSERCLGPWSKIFGRLACEDVLPHGTRIRARPDAVHLRGAILAWHGHLHSSHRTMLPSGFDEISMSCVKTLEADCFIA